MSVSNPPADDPAAPTRWAAVATLALATLIIASELTMSAFALPLIGAEFGVAPNVTAWVLLAYSLPMAALAISAGRWVDSSDFRAVFLFSLIAVGATSVLAAAAPSFELLIAARVLQGLVSALFLGVFLPIINASVRAEERGRAMGAVTTIMMLGSIALAPVGGFVAELYGWREVFLVKLPLLIPVLWLGYRTLPGGADPRRPRLARPDSSMLWETLLIGSAATGALLALEWAAEHTLLAAALMLLAIATGLWWTRLRASQPLIALLRRSAFGLPLLALLLTSSIIGLVVFLLPFFIVDVMGKGPKFLGLLVLLFVSAASLISPLAGSLADRCGPLPIAAGGGALILAGMLSLLALDADASALALGWRMLFLGVGMALFNAPTMTAILKAAPAGQTGVAGGVSGIARTLGNTLGPAACALAWNLAGGGIAGLHAGVIALSALSAAGFLALLVAHKRQPPLLATSSQELSN